MFYEWYDKILASVWMAVIEIRVYCSEKFFYSEKNKQKNVKIKE